MSADVTFVLLIGKIRRQKGQNDVEFSGTRRFVSETISGDIQFYNPCNRKSSE